MSVFDAVIGDQRSMEQFRSDAFSWAKKLADTGVLVGIGTDTPYLNNWSGESVYREMELWVNEIGISPLRTLQLSDWFNPGWDRGRFADRRGKPGHKYLGYTKHSLRH